MDITFQQHDLGRDKHQLVDFHTGQEASKELRRLQTDRLVLPFEQPTESIQPRIPHIVLHLRIFFFAEGQISFHVATGMTFDEAETRVLLFGDIEA